MVALVVEVSVIPKNIKEMATDEIDIPFWPGWDTIHTDWSPVGITAVEWKAFSANHFVISWNEWKMPIFAYIFFAVYGLSSQARDRYASIWSYFLGRLFYVTENIEENSLPKTAHLRPGVMSHSLSTM